MTTDNRHWENSFLNSTIQYVDLDLLIEQVRIVLLQQIKQNRCTLTNNLGYQTKILTDLGKLRLIVKDMLDIVTRTSIDADISISASTSGNILLLNVSGFKQLHYHQMQVDLVKAQDLAEEIGGCITLYHNRWTEPKLTLCVYDQQG